MPLHLHDTLARRKQAFRPQDPQRVGVYVCGPTVYDEPHIGNARPAVVFDVLVRLLRRSWPQVTYVRNITDVDDKILAAAAAAGIPARAVAEKYIKVYRDDMQALGVARPDIEPRVTESMDAILAMIARLLQAGNAYEAEGHVLFHVPSWRPYGELSRRGRDAMLAGARVEQAPYKRDPADFVLWKPSAPLQDGWESPWGRGRPGWHIECSAMIARHLGATVDIHGGGADLIFPHHENERAQSACAHAGAPLARCWMHNGFVVMGEDKMSKSLGNILTVRQLLRQAPGEAIRCALLSARYRKPLVWNDRLLETARWSLNKMYDALKWACGADGNYDAAEPDADLLKALEDDLDTPKALKRLSHLAREIHTAADEGEKRSLGNRLAASGALVGLLQQSPQQWFRWDWRDYTENEESRLDARAIEALLAERAAARRQGDFARADAIRARLAGDGVIVEDGADGGSEWRRETRVQHDGG